MICVKRFRCNNIVQLINSIESDFYRKEGNQNVENQNEEKILGLMAIIKKDPVLQQKVLGALLAHNV